VRGVLAFASFGVIGGACSFTALEDLQSGTKAQCTDCGDAGLDGDLPDAKSDDGGSDVMNESASEAGDSAGTFCSTQSATVAFCKDFDDGKPVGYGFESVEEPSPGLVQLDVTQSSSPPGSMKATVLVGTPTDDSYAYALRTFNETYDNVVLRFKILVDPSVIVSSSDVVGITVNPDTDYHGLNFEVTATGAAIEQVYPLGDGGTGYQDDGLNAFPLAGSWSSVEMNVSLVNPDPVITVKVDDQPLNAIPLVAGFAPGSIRIRIGPTFAPSLSSDLVVHIDDIVVELQ
jgi:hypothetical protein